MSTLRAYKKKINIIGRIGSFLGQKKAGLETPYHITKLVLMI